VKIFFKITLHIKVASSYGHYELRNYASKHFLIGQLVKFFLSIGLSKFKAFIASNGSYSLIIGFLYTMLSLLPCRTDF